MFILCTAINKQYILTFEPPKQKTNNINIKCLSILCISMPMYHINKNLILLNQIVLFNFYYVVTNYFSTRAQFIHLLHTKKKSINKTN